MKKCDVCQLTFKAGKFCNKCGGGLVDIEPQSTEGLVCVHCGNEGDTGKFCGRCGKSLAIDSKKDEEIIAEDPIETIKNIEAVIHEQKKENKPCEACGYAENVSKFCAKCGHTLSTPFIKDESVESSSETTDLKTNKKKDEMNIKSKIKLAKKEKKVKSKNTSAGKSKAKMKFKKIFLLSVLIVLITFVGTTGFYLNQSQIDFKIDREFKAESYFDRVRLHEFDGLNLIYELTDVEINYILDEYVDTDVDLPLGLKITGLFYKDNQINVQLDGGFIHTTALIDVSLKFENKQLFATIEKVAIGNKKIVLPIKSFIESSDLLKPIECPVYLKDIQVDMKSSSIKYEIVLDKDYFYDVLNDGYKTYSHERLLVLEALGLKNIKFIDRLKEKILDKSDDDLMDFLYKAINEENFFASYLYLIEPTKADDIVDMFVQDTIYLKDDETQKMNNELNKLRSELDDAYEEMAQKIIEKSIVDNGNLIFKDLSTYLKRHSYIDTVVAYQKRAYSSQNRELITINALKDYKKLSADSEMIFDLFYVNKQYYLTVQAFGKCYFLEEGKILSEHNSKTEALKYYDIESTTTIKTASLLHRGNADRTAIAGVVSDYVYSDNSIFINYLKSDGEWAYLIASPGDYPQSAAQYILKKYDSQWRIVQSISEYESFGTEIGSLLINDGFNVTVLPNFDMSNYGRWYQDYSDISGIVYHLRDINKISYNDEMNYFSRVDDTVAISFDNGKRFIFVYVTDNQYEYDDLYELSTEESYSDYNFIFDDQYNGIPPLHVFIQD